MKNKKILLLVAFVISTTFIANSCKKIDVYTNQITDKYWYEDDNYDYTSPVKFVKVSDNEGYAQFYYFM